MEKNLSDNHISYIYESFQNSMKKSILCLLFTAVFGGSIMAQLPNVGIKIAANSSRIPTSADVSSGQNAGVAIDETMKSLFGGTVGGFVRVNLKKFYIQPEALFSLKGGKFDLKTTYNTGSGTVTTKPSYTVNLSTIDVPIMLGYKLLDAEVMNLRVMAGPMASFVVGGEYKITQDGVDPSTGSPYPDQNLKAKDYIEGAIWSYQAGVGVDVATFTFDLRYEGSFTDIAKDVVGSNITFSQHISLIQLSAGFKFL